MWLRLLRLLVLASTTTAAPTTREAVADLKAELRMVRDLARLDWKQITDSGINAWAVLKLTPDRCAYDERADWWMTEDGKPMSIDGAGRQGRTVFGGRIDVLVTLRHQRTCLTRYEEVLAPGGNSPGPGLSEALYSPFHQPAGGVVLCRIVDGEPGIYRFMPAIMIRPTWEVFADPAMHLQQTEFKLFSIAEVGNNRLRLIKLLSDENPFVSITAFRTLAEAGGSDAELLKAVGAASDPVLQGAFTRLMLCSGSAADSSARIASLTQLVDGSASFNGVRGVVIGTLVAELDVPRRLNSGAGRTLIDNLITKSSRQNPEPEVDIKLMEMIRATTASQLPAMKKERQPD
jgi:hypothetical protein